jgi:hypothetical protein
MLHIGWPGKWIKIICQIICSSGKVLNRLSLVRIEEAKNWLGQTNISCFEYTYVGSHIINDKYFFSFYLFNIFWLYGKTGISCARWDVKWGWGDAKV